jgi:hypothetical protein
VVERRPEKAGVASSILAPGTTRTSAKQVPIPGNSKSRSVRRQRYCGAMFRKFSLSSWHISSEQPANILQALLNEFFNAIEARV